MTPNDGGQAFPIPDMIYPNGQIQPGANGMTLRDYFAAKALQAIIPVSGEAGKSSDVKHAYQYADMMIEERAKEKP